MLEKNWEYIEAVHKLFIDFKNVCDSFRREDLCNIPVEFGIVMKMVKLKRCVWMKPIAKSGLANI
jgi:hypothetical protein